jgi:hypothetical protein
MMNWELGELEMVRITLDYLLLFTLPNHYIYIDI